MQNEVQPKAPRWITTEAGRWAWEQEATWRTRALGALSVDDRSALLAEAEELKDSGVAAA